MKHSIFLILALFATGVKAEVIIPNTFVAGEAAVAADVNTNFTTVADGINSNETNINNNSLAISVVQSGINNNTNSITSLAGEIATNTLAIAGKADIASVQDNTLAIAGKADSSIGTDVLNNDIRITTLENVAPPIQKTWMAQDGKGNILGTILTMSQSTLSFITDKGYVRPNIHLNSGRDSNTTRLYYAQSSCQGQAYTISAHKTIFIVKKSLSGAGTAEIYYAVGKAQWQGAVSYNDYGYYTDCKNLTSSQTYLTPAFKNDPIKTGVTTTTTNIWTPISPVYK